MNDSNKYFEGLLHNDSKVIEEIYQDLAPTVEKYIYTKGGNEDDAADVFQEGLMVVLTMLEKGKPKLEGGFKGYLFGICRNIWRNKRKRKGVIMEDVSLGYNEKAMKEVLFENEDGELGLIAEDTAREISLYQLFYKEMAKLSKRCQELAELKFQKISQNDIMVKMNFPSIGRVGKKWSDCKKQLKKLVRNHPDFKNLYPR